MIEIYIPPARTVKLKYLCLDLNGTIAFNKELVEGVAGRLDKLKESLEIRVITADTFGNASEILKNLPVTVEVIPADEQGKAKATLVNRLGAEFTASMGNGYNDRLMLAASALSVVVMGREGCSRSALEAADISIHSINDALDLLLYPERVKATLRD